MKYHENKLTGIKVISTINSDITWLISRATDNLSSFHLDDMENFIIFTQNRNKHDKYIVKLSLPFIYKNEWILTELTKLGVSDIIVTDVTMTDLKSEILIRVCNLFKIWLDISSDNSELPYNLNTPPFFFGVCLGFDNNKVWDVIANKVISQLHTRIFVYGVSCSDIRVKLYNWIDYIAP
ncbi:hypothetical protein JNC30_004665 [Salmonella enterica]|nr:hypothetical protein [Salmonella enterica]EGM3390168.1 hypothetical protein [Salmonella enterica]EHE3387877.1 hypothetical protein [Salmonella enterica]